MKQAMGNCGFLLESTFCRNHIYQQMMTTKVLNVILSKKCKWEVSRCFCNFTWAKAKTKELTKRTNRVLGNLNHVNSSAIFFFSNSDIDIWQYSHLWGENGIPSSNIFPSLFTHDLLFLLLCFLICHWISNLEQWRRIQKKITKKQSQAFPHIHSRQKFKVQVSSAETCPPNCRIRHFCNPLILSRGLQH